MTQDKQLTAPVSGLTPAMAVAIFKRQYPGVPEAEIMKAGLICYNYKLFPYGNQVFIIPFQKKDKDSGRYVETFVTVIGIKGLREIAKNTGNRFSYLNGDGPRVMTTDEEIQIYGAADQTYIRAIVKIKNDRNEVFPGYGNFKRSDTPYGSDKGNTGFNMAFIRAERNAIDRMAPGALPDVEIIDESFVDAPVSQIVSTGEKQLAIQNARDVKELWPSEPETITPPVVMPEVVDAQDDKNIDMDWLKESLKSLQWADVGGYLKRKYKVTGASVSVMVGQLTKEQAAEFVKEVTARLEIR